LQIPINRPINPQYNYQRDGLMTVNENGAAGPNYFPNSVEGTALPNPQRPDIHLYQSKGGAIGRKVFKKWQEQDDYDQPGALFRLMPRHEQDQLIEVRRAFINVWGALAMKRLGGVVAILVLEEVVAFLPLQ
jgi:catalase